MQIALLVVMVVVALLVILLAVPVDVRFAAARPAAGPLQKTIRLRWGFGLVELPLGRRRARSSRAREPREKTKPRSGSRIQIRRLLANPQAWQRGKVLLTALLRAIHWRMLRLRARFGLDDPADTGMAWGAVGPFVAVLIPSHRDVQITPSFAGAELELRGEGELRLVPLQVLWVLLRFALSPATWRVFRSAMVRK